MLWRLIALVILVGTSAANADVAPEPSGCRCGTANLAGAMLAVGTLLSAPRRRR